MSGSGSWRGQGENSVPAFYICLFVSVHALTVLTERAGDLHRGMKVKGHCTQVRVCGGVPWIINTQPPSIFISVAWHRANFPWMLLTHAWCNGRAEKRAKVITYFQNLTELIQQPTFLFSISLSSLLDLSVINYFKKPTQEVEVTVNNGSQHKGTQDNVLHTASFPFVNICKIDLHSHIKTTKDQTLTYSMCTVVLHLTCLMRFSVVQLKLPRGNWTSFSRKLEMFCISSKRLSQSLYLT